MLPMRLLTKPRSLASVDAGAFLPTILVDVCSSRLYYSIIHDIQLRNRTTLSTSLLVSCELSTFPFISLSKHLLFVVSKVLRIKYVTTKLYKLNC